MANRTGYDIKLSKRLAKRSLKCDADIKLEDIQLDQRVIDNGWQFLLDDKILDFFEKRFDYFYQNKDTYSMYENFLQSMFIKTYDNYVYQQMMEYIRSYIDWRELSDGEMLSGQRAMVNRRMDEFDPALSKYYEEYKEKLQSRLAQVQQDDDEEIKKYSKKYCVFVKEILVFIYTYLYVNELEADFSLIDKLELMELVAKVLLGQTVDGSQRTINFSDDQKKRELIDYLLGNIHKKQISYKKTNNTPVARGTIYK